MLELIAEPVLEAGLERDAEAATEVAPEVAAEVSLEAAEILDCVLSASLGIGDPMELIVAVAVETDSVVDAETAVEASDVPTRVGNLSFKLVGYAVPEERETELPEVAVDAAGKLDCELGEFALKTAAVLEEGFAVDGEYAADDAAEGAAEEAAEETTEVAADVSLEAAEILACVLSASLEIGDPMELIGAVSVKTDSIVDTETSVEASDVPTRVGNLSFKLVGYAVPEERETELAKDAGDAAVMLGCEIGKLELTTPTILDAEDTAEVAPEVAAEVSLEAAEILDCVLSASLGIGDPMELIGAVAVETDSVVDAETAVEASDVPTRVASDVPTRVGNLSFKLVGYAVPEERGLELAEEAIDTAGMLDCELGEFALKTAAVLEEGFAVDGEYAADDAAEGAAEVFLEAAEILACVLSTSLGIGDPMELIVAVAVETDSVVDAETAVEASDVPTRVGNLSFKLVGYAVPEERETELPEAAVDAAGKLDCELGVLELTIAAVLEAEFSDNGEEAAMLVRVLGAPFLLDDPFELSAAAVSDTGSEVDTEESVEASDIDAGVLDSPEKCPSETLLDARFKLNPDAGVETAFLEL
ncbi:hypothetical protein E4U58_005919 [Claviceps cyperi]|nr:hypothetical protein E4U58_005919 [Claviceps cyperi]